ncbi:MAG: FAD-binding protein [Xanthobacteraceae bacterium]|nr:FAD-binding protein [Xanthobacteraceae bacterium]
MGQDMNADVVIVGGGLAGLAAGLTAAAGGARVSVLEQGADPRYLCNSRITMGVFQIALNDMESGAAALVGAITQATRGHVDPALAERYAGEAANSIRWLRAQSIRLIRGGAAAANLGVLSPPVPRRPGLHWEGRAGDVMLRQLTGNLEQLGGALHRGVRARELVMEGGHCVGVVATRGDETLRWRGGAVVIADGGFQANPDLVRQHISKSPEKLLQRNAGTGRGDGLLMAQAIGADVTELEYFYGHVQSRDAMHNATLWPYPTMDFLVAAGMAVDAQAERFTDEGLAGVAIANAVARLDDPLGAIAIFDQAIWEASAKTYVMSANPFLIDAGGTLLRADTIAELADRTGLPGDALARTVADYNHAVEANEFSKLTPPRSLDHPHPWGSRPMPIRQPPFVAVPLCAGLTYTMGGLKVDPQARVLHTQGQPITGLFAAGGSIGGLEGGPYVGYTGGLAKALVFGRIAGASALALCKPKSH